MTPQIHIGADHRGFELKTQLVTWLQQQGYRVTDWGNDHFDPDDDYPDYAQPVAEAVATDPQSLGVVLCGSGVGVTVVANKIDGVRAADVADIEQVKQARQDDDLNVLSLAADTLDLHEAQKLVEAFISTSYQATERHQRRLDKIAALEEQT